MVAMKAAKRKPDIGKNTGAELRSVKLVKP
jgi:hypothetical protein